MSKTMEIRLDRLEEIEGFIEALDDWGCIDPVARQAEIKSFLTAPVGLTQYLDRDVPEVSGRA